MTQAYERGTLTTYVPLLGNVLTHPRSRNSRTARRAVIAATPY